MREIKKGEHALLAVSFWYRPARKNTRLSAAIWSRHILTDLMLRELLAAWKLTIGDVYRLFMVSIFAEFIKELNISGCNLDNETFKEVASIVALKKLKCGNNLNFELDSIEALALNSTLTSLHLNNTSIGDDAV